MVVIGAVVVLVLVVVLLSRGRTRRSAGATAAGDTPWESLDRGEDPTEPA